jgi:hypothetical protein
MPRLAILDAPDAREGGYGQSELGGRIGMTHPAVGYAVQMGEHIAKENNFLNSKINKKNSPTNK